MGELILPFVLGVFLLFQVLKGQTKALQEKQGVEGTQVTVLPPAMTALESPVDPDNYHIGPSDGIQVNLWRSPPLSYSLTVTPEGTLIVPMVSEIKVADMSLRQAKVKVIDEIRKKYITGDVTVTLVMPRSVVVTVTGRVQSSGAFTLGATNRVDRAINQAVPLPDASQRNITLHRRSDGSEIRVDIPMYYATRRDEWNPYVREGDVIVVNSSIAVKNVIAVYGAVNSPGRFEFVPGDSITEAIRLAQGFNRLAKTDSVELSRFGASENLISTQIVNLREIMEGERPDVILEPGDRIVVKEMIELRQDYRVTVTGEVLYPSVYPVTRNSTRLSELLRRAGGMTEFADLKSSELIRHSIPLSGIETERLLSLRGDVTAEDSADYYIETSLRIRKEIVNVDFERLIVHGDSTQDVILQDEDLIVIPSIKKTIYVFGQVVTPGHIPFVSGEDPGYYIKKAGGFTDRARKGDLRIIKCKTKQWLSPGETEVEEGDYIWVPRDPDRTFSYYMLIASQAASILSVVIGIGVIIIQVTK